MTSQIETYGTYTATTLNAYDAEGRQYCTVAPVEAALGVTCPTSAVTAPLSSTSTDPKPGATLTVYDANGRVIQTINPLGGLTDTEYDDAGEVVCSVDPVEAAAAVTCPTTLPSTPTTSSDPYLGATITTYDSNGQVVQVTNPLGGITLTSYDAAGNVASSTVESNNATPDPNVVTSYVYDPDNRAISTTIGAGSSTPETTVSAYDPDGNLYCSVSANAYAQGLISCPSWAPSWISAPPSPTALYANSQSPTSADGVTMSFYDANGNLLQETTPENTSPTSSLTSTTVNVVDPDGHPYCVANGTDMAAWLSVHTTSTYPYLCPTSPPTSAPSTGSNPGYETKIYNAAGNLLSDTDASGDTNSSAYDVAGDVTSTTSGTGGVTTNCYYFQSCASGAPSAGGAASALYSSTSPATQADSGGVVTTYTYLSGGVSHVTTTPAGTTTNGYDANGDLTSASYSATASGYSTPANVSHTYFPDGTQETTTDGTGTTTTTVNAMGQTLTSAFVAGSGTGLTSATTTYTYFDTGARASLTYPPLGSVSTPEVTYTYDDTGAEASLTDWQSHTTTFSHDADGNTTSSAYPNSTTVADTYNLGDGETEVSAAPTSTPTSPFATYSTPRGAIDQVTSETDTGTGTTPGTTSYSYNGAQQLSGVNSTTASYDASGNVIDLPNGSMQNYDAAGELCWNTPTVQTPAPTDPNARCTTGAPSGATTYTYDSLGDRTASTGPAGSATSALSYNQTGELTGDTPGLNASSYNVVTPTRVCDTRSGNPSGLSGTANQCDAETFSGAGTISAQLSGSGMPVPTNATAVVADLTVVDNSSSGSGSYVTVYPTGQTQPGVSNIRVPLNAIANNQVTVGVGTNISGAKSISLYNSSDSVDVIIDVVGYYAGSGGSSYVPVTATRICDTRSGNPSGLSSPDNQCNGSHLSSGGTINVTAAGTGFPAPAGATAVVADVTDVAPTAGGHLTAYEQGSTRPAISSLNAASGAIVTKEVTIELNTSNGEFTVYNSAGTTDIVVDIEGYFMGSSNSVFNPITPTRICDTRSGNPSSLSGPEAQCNGSTLGSGGTETIAAAGLAGVPSSATAVVADVTTVNETGSNRLTVYAAGVTRPATSQINYTAGAIDDDEVTVGVGTSGDIILYNNSGSTDVLVDVLGYYESSSTPPASTYTYNGEGLRTSATIGGTTNQFTYDTTASIPAVLEDGTYAFVYGPSGEPVEQINTSATAYYFVSDLLGSTRALTNGSGTVVATFNYAALGNITSQTGAVTTPIGFAGAYTDSNSGLLYLVNRYYDPNTGQFLTVDPDVAETGQPYSYASDDPIDIIDPSGDLDTASCSDAVTALTILTDIDSAKVSDEAGYAHSNIHFKSDPSRIVAKVWTTGWARPQELTVTGKVYLVVPEGSEVGKVLLETFTRYSSGPRRSIVQTDPLTVYVNPAYYGATSYAVFVKARGSIDGAAHDNNTGSEVTVYGHDQL